MVSLRTSPQSRLLTAVAPSSTDLCVTMRFSFTTAIIIFSIGAYAAPVNETVVEKSVEALDERADIVDFYNPTLSGGSFLDLSAGLGEPLNVIIFCIY